MKNNKIITEDDLKQITKQIDRINIKLMNYRIEIYEKVYRTRVLLISLFVILIMSVIISYTI